MHEGFSYFYPANMNYIGGYSIIPRIWVYHACMMCPLLYNSYKLHMPSLYHYTFHQKRSYNNEIPAITADTHTTATFKALTDAIIPNTPETDLKPDNIQSYGAADSHADEYMIWTLEHYLSLSFDNGAHNIPLAKETAKMLDAAARQLISIGGNEVPINPNQYPKGGTFAALAPSDRFRAITLLERLQVNLANLPVPFRDNSSLVIRITGMLNVFAMMGYYSEWSGYGSTRLETPSKRKLEYFPIGWKQTGYPGPSKGYHALRGYPVEKFTE